MSMMLTILHQHSDSSYTWKYIRKKYDTSKVHIHLFQGYKRYVKNVILYDYSEICLIRNCYVCKISNWGYL